MDLLENIFNEICMPIFALALIRGIFTMRNLEKSHFGKITACIGTVVISNMFLLVYVMWAFSEKEKGGVVAAVVYIIGYFIVHYWNFSDLIKKEPE